MSELFNKRRHPRKAARLEVFLRYGGQKLSVTTKDIGLGGVFLTMSEVPPANTILELEIDLPTAEGGVEHVRVVGVVIYSIEGKGVGIEFQWWDDQNDVGRQTLQRYLDARPPRPTARAGDPA
jgi:hypothetical protein